MNVLGYKIEKDGDTVTVTGAGSVEEAKNAVRSQLGKKGEDDDELRSFLTCPNWEKSDDSGVTDALKTTTKPDEDQ